MSTIKSSTDHLTLNADGASKDIKFQANGVEKASISSAGAFTSTTIDATKLTGNLPAISGASLTNLPSTPSVLSMADFMQVQDQKVNGTSAGANSTGEQTRTLNTVVVNNITGATLISNLVTLPAGTYWVEAQTGTYSYTGSTKAILRNTTDSNNVAIGSMRRNTASNGSTECKVSAYFTIAAEKSFAFRMYTSNAYSYGLGYAGVTDSNIEVYSDMKIWKVA